MAPDSYLEQKPPQAGQAMTTAQRPAALLALSR